MSRSLVVAWLALAVSLAPIACGSDRSTDPVGTSRQHVEKKADCGLDEDGEEDCDDEGGGADHNPPKWKKSSTLTASAIAATSLTLTWTAAHDNKGVTAYRVYRAGTLIATVSGATLSYAVSGLTASTSYTFKVEAGDAAGLWSVTGPSTTATTLAGGGGKPNGATCGASSECSSAQCADGVCCDSACAGQCETCNATGSVGTCKAVTGAPVGGRTACTGTGTSCGGSCDGASRTACTYPGASTSCRSASCTGGVATVAAGCDGAGTCPTAVTTSCAPYVCGTTACLSACTADSDCVSGDFCSAGTCTAKKANGATCTAAKECSSASCADGVCCNSACGGQCEACNLTGTVGTCTAVSGAPISPRTACASDGSVCGGSCDGTLRTACTYATSSTSCRSASCTSGLAVAAAGCNGAGSCPAPVTTSCSPFVCGSSACLVTCASDADCIAGDFCSAGACVPKKGSGVACAAASQCVSGNCVDGVCCDTGCGGQCEACNVAGSVGTCAATTGAPTGSRTACTGAGTTCGGTCNGTLRTACSYPSSSTSCRSASCTAGTATASASCDGAGACPTPSTSSCSPYVCGSTVCLSTCSSDADCVTGDFCNAGSCEPKKGGGTACTSASQCTSANCVDGVCCDTACGGQCEACNVTGSIGTCTAVAGKPTGSRSACTGDGTTCGGSCDGTLRTACTYPGSTTSCRTASCTSGVAVNAANCDGAGACPAAKTTSCDPYVCGSTACLSTCVTDADCIAGDFCSAGTCTAKKANGAACASAGQCTSGNCADGVCCDTACSGQCEACGVAGSVGTCTAVSGAPVGSRTACASDGTACAGTCDGTLRTACTYPGSTTSCRSASCTAGSATASASCDGAGACPPVSKTTCAPYVCGSTSCLSSCATDSDCVSGDFCNGSSACVAKLANGSACLGGSMCASSNCVDGFCCDSGCSGQCESCGISGSEGTCTAVTGAPTGSRSACASDGSLCGGTCDGTTRTSCSYPSATTSCRTASCSGGAAVAAAGCNGAGACPPVSSTACAPYACGTVSCLSSCTTSADCAAGSVCTAGACGADTTAPTWPTATLTATAISSTSVSLGWTAATDDAAVTAYRVYRDGVLIATLGTSLSTTVTGLTKGTTYLFKVEAGDAAGNYSTTGPSTSFVAVPVLAAPPLDRTVTTDIASATAFLYTGTDPVQTGVVPGTIDPVRVGVLRGRATTTTGAALPGIAVSVLGHPEFGSTVSRADGAFDLAVNGGGDLTLRYVKPGFPELQRTLNVPWRMYAIAPDVILTPYDTANTAITLSSLTGIAVHRASTSSDLDASRRPTLLFSPGTTATMTLADGTVTPIDTLHVRATEFTVGESGPNAMPADLPPTSHYTYSAEWSVDEAVAASASRVSFSQPVVLYLENFLSFPTGTIVPEGTYDRAVAHWSAEPNGRVVKVLSMTGGRANLDIDGSGSPASAAALLALGVTDAERDQVATLYAVGQSLWRVPLMHFSACDLNWAVASGGPPKAKPGKEPTECAQEEHGSIIECENQLLGENLSIAGTPFQLHYHSDRSHLASRNQVSHAFPADVDFLDGFLAVEVAGRSLIATAKPGDSVTIEWDGYDAYGRFTNGRQPARVSIGYHRKAVYKSTPSFGGTTGATLAAITAASGRKALWLYTSYHTRLGTYDAHPTGLGGWEIDAHHFYSPGSRIAYFGNGKRRGSNGATPTQFIQTVAGGGVGGDGGPATGASLNTPFGLAIAPDGSLYIADRDANRIRRVDPAGIITTFAGGGTLTGDDILATDAKLSLSTAPWTSIAIGPDGAVYFTEGTRIDVVRAGKIRRYAGTGVTGFSGDGGPARSAQINQPAALTFGPRGLYFSDGATRVRLIDLTTELIQTIAGTGDPGDFGYGDGGQATAASMTPNGLAFDAAGRMYITDFGGLKSKIRRVDTAGVITTIAGSSSGFSGDGGSPLAARLFAPAGIAIGRDAAIYFADNNNGRIRRISPDESVILTVAGNGAGGSTPIGEGLSPTDAMLAGPAAIAFGPEGSLYIADVLNHRIRRIVNALPGFTAAEITLPAESGSSLFVFDSLGRHLKTLDTLTGKTLLTFGYDTSGRLASITDLDGDVTTITRSGSSFDITGPFGQKTTVVVGTDGNASKVTNPAGDSVSMTYEPGFGFLKTLTDPRGGLHTFTFDEVGRLEKDEGPGGWSLTLTRPTAIEFDVRTVSAEGRSKEHQLFELPTGGERRITTSTAGVSTITDMPSNHSATSTAPDGTISTRSLVPDPRFGFNSPILGPSRVTTPAGLVATASAGRAVLLTLPSDPTSVKTLIESFTVNGQTFTSTYDAPTRKVTATTPLGRKSITTLDTNGRPVQSSVTGFTPVDVVYDAHGRPTSVTQGTRSVTYAYGSDGLLASVTDPLLRTTSFTRDAIGRVLKQTLPDLREVSFTYDASGNVTSVTPPTRPVHSFTYTAADQPNNYIAPTVGTETPVTTYAYNKDHQVTSVTRPDGSFVGFTYDFAGRPSIVTHATDITTMTYDGAERLSTIANTPETITFTYDGSLVTDTTWTGAVAGVVHRDYDANFRVKTQSVNSAFPITLTYDNDGLLTGAGSLVLTRDTTNGVLKGTTLGSVTDTITLSAFGELASYKATYATTTSLYEATFTRDSVGRISTKTEIVGGVTKTYGYTYDTAGRLTDVTLGGTLTAHYGYDGNSNRATKTAGGTTTTGAYDAQDRLITYGTKTYIFTTNGELKTVSDTATGLVTNYAYDALGNLLSVTPSVGAKIEYIVDGANRRVGKKVAGVLTQAWIYQNALKPVASLDPISGAVLQRYVYGSRGVVPDYVVTPTATYRVISDHLGSPRVVVDVATGAIVQRTDYDEFGNVTAETIATGWTALPFGFAGGMYDRDTKLVRFGARDYDGENGRWTTKDPIGFGGGAANFYGYAANDPVNGADPTGLLLGVTWNDVDYALTTHGEDIALGVAAVSIAPLAVYGVSYAAIAADAAFGAAAMHVLTRAGPAIGALLGFGQRGCDFARKLAADTSGSLSLPSATTEPAKQLGSSGVFHHIFPRAFAGRFAQLGINVDNFTMRIAPSLHNSIHEPPFTSGGWWNAAWATWFANNPNATAKDAFIFAGELIHKFGLSGGPVVPYPH